MGAPALHRGADASSCECSCRSLTKESASRGLCIEFYDEEFHPQVKAKRCSTLASLHVFIVIPSEFTFSRHRPPWNVCVHSRPCSNPAALPSAYATKRPGVHVSEKRQSKCIYFCKTAMGSRGRRAQPGQQGVRGLRRAGVTSPGLEARRGEGRARRDWRTGSRDFGVG